ncbi:MAG: hypothetical protein R2774_01925 [Saprospiraceae bacterium]
MYYFFLNIVFCGSIFSQISIEFNSVGAKPFETFGENINRDGYFGLNFGLFYKPTKTNYLSFGVQFYHLPYDESTFSDLQFEDNLFIRQRFKSKVGMQTFHSIIRASLKKQNKIVNPFFDGILGLNRFYGITRSEDAFFQGDTNNNDVIDDSDGEINPADLGITTSISLATASTKINHSSISPTIGLGFGLKIKIIKFLKFDTRIAYMHGFQTTYYDYGSQDIIVNSIDNFVLVRSAIPVLFWTMGLNFTFE